MGPEDADVSDMKVAPGTFLVAGPELLDPNFMHAVVLMCQHSDQGAIGLVVNRMLPHTTAEAFPDHPLLGAVDMPIFQGGPVELDSMQFVHRAPDEIPGSVQLAEGLWWGQAQSVADFLGRAGARAAESVRLFIGYSGWGAGQLEGELVGGVWLPAAGSADLVFEADRESMWRDVLRSLGDAAEGLSDQPPDPSWN